MSQCPSRGSRWEHARGRACVVLAAGESDGAGRSCVPNGYRYGYVIVRYDVDISSARTPWPLSEFFTLHHESQ